MPEYEKNHVGSSSNVNNVTFAMLHYIPNPVMVIDPDTSIIFVNTALEKITGFSSGELIGAKSPYPFWPENKWQKYAKDFEDALLDTENIHQADRIFIKKNALSFWASVTSAPMIEEGKLRYVITNWVDITLHTIAEEKLRRSEERFRFLAENTRDLIYRIRFFPEIACEYISPSATAITGYTPEEHYSDPLLGTKMFHPDDKHLLREMAENPGFYKKPINLRWIRKDGTVIWTEQENIPILDDSGKVIAMEGIARDITERKQIEEQSKESSQRFKSLFEYHPDAAYSLDCEGKFLSVNKSGCRLFGYSPEELLTMTFWHLVIPKELDKAHLYLNLANSGMSQSCELAILNKTGQNIDVSITNIPIVLDGKVTGIYGIAKDITEQKRAKEQALKAEADLRRSEAQYRDVVDNLNEGILTLDKDNFITFTNSSIFEMLGYDSDELIGKHLFSLMDNKGVALTQEYINLRMKGTRERLETELIRKDGNRIFALLQISPILDGQGRLSEIVACVLNITKRKQAEDKFRESEAFNSSLLKNSPTPILVINPDTSIRYVNPALEKLTGYSSAELIGQKCPYPYWPEEDKLAYQDGLTYFLKKIKQYKSEGWTKSERRLKKKNGEFFLVDVAGTVIRDSQGNPQYYLIDWKDITEPRRIEEEKQKAAEEIQDLYNNAPCGYHCLDKEGVFVRINDTELSWLGYSIDEIIGRKKFIEILTPESREYFRKNYFDFKEQGVQDVEYTMIRKDGCFLPILLSATAIKDASGEFIMSRATVYDITERKKVEEKLRESEERFRQVAEVAGEWIWEVDAEGIYRYASPIVQNILGYTPDELVGKVHFYDLFHSELRDHMKGLALEGFKKKESIRSFVNPNVHKDGRIVILETSGVPILSEKGDLLGYRGTNTDITERQKAEEALKASEKNFHDSIERSPLGIRIVDQEGYPLYANQALLDILGYRDIEELRAIPIKERLTPESYSARLDRIQRRRNGEYVPSNYEISIVSKDGEVRHLAASRGEVLWNNTKQFQVVYQDITEHKEAEQALRKSELKLRTFLEQAQDGILLTDNKGTVIECNKAGELITGLKREEVVGRYIWDVQYKIMPEERKSINELEQIKATISEVLKTEKSSLAEQTF